MPLRLPHFSPLCVLCPVSPFPPAFSPHPPFSSCAWVVHIKLLGFSISILFLTCLFCTYQLCFLFLLAFPSFFSFPLPTDNLPRDLQLYDSVPLLVVCLVHFCLGFFCVCVGSVVGSCEFLIYLLFIVLIFFFLGKSLFSFHIIRPWLWWTPLAFLTWEALYLPFHSKW